MSFVEVGVSVTLRTSAGRHITTSLLNRTVPADAGDDAVRDILAAAQQTIVAHGGDPEYDDEGSSG